MAVSVFLDTSVLLAGLVDVGPQSAPAQTIMHAVAEKTIQAPGTAWHCCLEFYSVATRLPPEFRLTPADALRASPAYFPKPAAATLYTVAGGDESEEFLRQNESIRAAWGAEVVPVCEAIPATHHMNVLHELADRRDFGDAGYRVELVADEPVLQTSKVPKGHRRALERVPEHVANARRVRPKRRRYAGWQRGYRRSQALQDPRASPIEICPVCKGNLYKAVAEHALAADTLGMRNRE